MKKISLSVFVMSLFVLNGAFAAEEKEGPCKTIIDKCTGANFKAGQWKEGTGLWADCVCPIVLKKPQPKIAKAPLPAVGDDVISACLAKRPNICKEKEHRK